VLELFALRRRSFDGNTLTLTETIYRGKLRGYGKTKGSLTTVNLPPELAQQIKAWLDQLEDKKPDAFMFPNADGGFILKDNYLHRVLYPLQERTDEKGQQSGLEGIKKLNFQILRRTFATLAQHHGTVKDVQRQMRHSKPNVAAEVYMQAIPESVQKMVTDMYAQLIKPVTERVQ
jgi:integrase